MTASPEVLGYESSAQKLILKALESGDSEMLRCVKELMDFTQAEVAALTEERDELLDFREQVYAAVDGRVLPTSSTTPEQIRKLAAGAAREAALREAGSTLVHLLGRFNGNACDDEITNALLAWQRAALAEEGGA